MKEVLREGYSHSAAAVPPNAAANTGALPASATTSTLVLLAACIRVKKSRQFETGQKGEKDSMSADTVLPPRQQQQMRRILVPLMPQAALIESIHEKNQRRLAILPLLLLFVVELLTASWQSLFVPGDSVFAWFLTSSFRHLEALKCIFMSSLLDSPEKRFKKEAAQLLCLKELIGGFGMPACFPFSGFKIIVVTHAIDGRHGIRYLTEGIKVYYLPITCFHDRSTLVTFFATLPLIRTILIRERVDIVHGHQTTSTLAHESMLHARHLGYRVVYTDHSMFSFADAACIHMNKIFKFFLTHCNHCICVSHTHKENLVLRGALNPHQIAVINNAVDVPAYVPDLSKRPAPPAINILILSRLSYRKGIDLLVDMIPPVCAKYPNVTFIIGGDGPKRIILEEMREKHRIHDRVEMLEAAACGLVVVSTDVGGIPEVLPPDMVRLASPNPAALTLQLEEAIRQVERGDVDPHALHQRVLEMYSWEDVADRVEQVYFSALFDLPMSANLRKGISLSNVPLPPNPPPLPTAQEAVQVLRALNRCGPFSGKFFALVAIVDWCLVRFVEWLFPRDSIEEAASFPSDVLYSVKTNLPSSM
ncbi:phosphatidylinositolglycan class A protein, putative [Eimeria praecox]|uniref:Phosphatidylinositolglycan class A protein, putative n=1 Tax=Eimeria praecox TaxID=51316 RepID=U6GFE3_9EIME|nr:phosphatidylinositolglycan class A protein, putative [Eimeria praecox]